MPPDDDPDEDDEEEPDKDQKTDFLRLWATAVMCGVPDSEWQNITIPKLKALNKARRERERFDITIHGGEIKKKPKTAKYLSDLGFYIPGTQQQ